MSDEDWLELYTYLLRRLDEKGFPGIREEIEDAASAPVTEESKPEDEARISKAVREEVGRIAFRRRQPKEVFEAAVRVLQSRLIELPKVAESLAERLQVPKDRIEFRLDYEQRYALVESAPIPLTQLTLSESDATHIRESFKTLWAETDLEIEKTWRL